jgi:phytoene/squalene synthetase
MDTRQALDHCRELVLQPGGTFEFSSQFIPGDAMPQILAVYALKQAVASIPYTHVDDVVKWEKLKWWGQELLADSSLASRHPIIRALVESGAREKLDDVLLVRLVSSALEQVDAAPASDEHAMLERFTNTGLAESRLEYALDDLQSEPEGFGQLAAASTLFGVICSFLPGRQPQVERLPLNALAKHGVTQDVLAMKPFPAEVLRLFEDCVELALSWYAAGRKQARGKPVGVAETHLRLRWALESRCLTRVQKNTERFFRQGMRYGPGDAFFAWRYLRHLN